MTRKIVKGAKAQFGREGRGGGRELGVRCSLVGQVPVHRSKRSIVAYGLLCCEDCDGREWGWKQIDVEEGPKSHSSLSAQAWFRTSLILSDMPACPLYK